MRRGSPSQRTTVIEKGVLNSHLYDTYTAGKAGVYSTGNSSRSSYMSPPSVGLRISVSVISGYVLLLTLNPEFSVNTVIGAHTANSISGGFLVEARNAFTNKDGALDKPIKSLMISGNSIELLKS